MKQAGAPPGWALWVAVVIGLTIGVLHTRPPAPQPASAPAAAFSAQRAFADVAAFAQAPHPIGSVEAARVRDRIAARMTALGLQVERHPGVGVASPKWAGVLAAAQVENLVGRLPGRDPASPALLLMAHADSVPNSPGAADDAAGVAAALEVMRALKTGGTPARDVLVLVTDGEEPGLLGAEAFFRADPLRRHVGAVINLEARGASGRALMFETGPRAGGWIDLYRRGAAGARANSLMAAVYHHMPNGTDFTEALQAGVPGLNLAFSGDQFDYHTAHATPAALDRGSLQSMGDQALGAARAAAFSPRLPAPAADPTYSDLPGFGLVTYPAWAGWLLAAGEALAFAVLAIALRRRGLASLAGIAVGASVTVGMTLLAAAGLQVAGLAFGGYADVQQRYAVLGRYGWAICGSAALAFGLALAVLRLARARTSAWSLWLGALALGLALTVALQAAAPPTAFAVAWPLASGLAAAACVLAWPGAVGVAAGAALAGLGLAQVVSLGVLVFSGVGVDLAAALAVAVPLAALPLAGFAAGEGRRGDALAPALAVTLGAGMLAIACWPRTGTEARPNLTQALLLWDPAARRAEWISPQPRVDAWTRAVLASGGGTAVHAPEPPTFAFPVWRAPARPVGLTAPRLSVARSGAQVAVRIAAANGGRELRVKLRTPTPFRDARLQGVEVQLPRAGAGGWTGFNFAAPPAEGVTLTFVQPLSAPVEVSAVEVVDGFPRGQAPPVRPPALQPFGLSDVTLVRATQAFPP